MRGRFVVAGGLVMLSLVGAVAMIGGRGSNEVPTMVVEATPFRVRLTADGVLEAAASTALTAPVQVRRQLKVAWQAPDGSMVRQGDVVVRFDPAELETAREDGLTDRRIGGLKIERAAVERDAELADLERDADVARNELETAREFQTTDSEIYSRVQIAESTIDTELAEHRASHAETSRTIKAELSEADLELLRIERRKAELTVQEAEDALASLEITAPHDGVLIFERDWQGRVLGVGETVWPGRPVARIPDLGVMQAEIFVLEADAGGLAPGLAATVTLEAWPDDPIPARVASVDPIAQRRQRWVPVQYFRAVLTLEHGRPERLKPGARVRAEVVVADLEAALTVPRQAVGSVDGGSVVWRRVRGGFEATPVELGVAAVGRVVVLSGIAAGDEIALRDPEKAAAAAGRDPADGENGPSLGGRG